MLVCQEGFTYSVTHWTRLRCQRGLAASNKELYVNEILGHLRRGMHSLIQSAPTLIRLGWVFMPEEIHTTPFICIKSDAELSKDKCSCYIIGNYWCRDVSRWVLFSPPLCLLLHSKTIIANLKKNIITEWNTVKAVFLERRWRAFYSTIGNLLHWVAVWRLFEVLITTIHKLALKITVWRFQF